MEGARAPGRPRTSSPLRGALVSFSFQYGTSLFGHVAEVRALPTGERASLAASSRRTPRGSENGLGRCQWLIDHVSCDAWVRSWLAI